MSPTCNSNAESTERDRRRLFAPAIARVSLIDPNRVSRSKAAASIFNRCNFVVSRAATGDKYAPSATDTHNAFYSRAKSAASNHINVRLRRSRGTRRPAVADGGYGNTTLPIFRAISFISDNSLLMHRSNRTNAAARPSTQAILFCCHPQFHLSRFGRSDACTARATTIPRGELPPRQRDD